MRRRHVRHRPHKHTGNLPSPLLQYVLLGCIILCGVVWGAVLARQAGLTKENGFSLLMQETLSKNAAQRGFWNLLLSSFFSSSILLCAAFVFGLCALGSPGHIAVMLFKGAGIGLSMGYIYMEYGMKGFAICAIFILPWAALTSLAVMVACREGIRFSISMARIVLPSGSAGGLWADFCEYCMKYLICFGLVLAAALIESLSTIAFSMLFFS